MTLFVNIPYLCCPKGLKWTLVKSNRLGLPFFQMIKGNPTAAYTREEFH